MELVSYNLDPELESSQLERLVVCAFVLNSFLHVISINFCSLDSTQFWKQGCSIVYMNLGFLSHTMMVIGLKSALKVYPALTTQPTRRYYANKQFSPQ